MNDREILEALYATVENRRDNPKEGSYTCYLLAELDKRSEKTGNLKKFHVVDKNS